MSKNTQTPWRQRVIKPNATFPLILNVGLYYSAEEVTRIEASKDYDYLKSDHDLSAKEQGRISAVMHLGMLSSTCVSIYCTRPAHAQDVASLLQKHIKNDALICSITKSETAIKGYEDEAVAVLSVTYPQIEDILKILIKAPLGCQISQEAYTNAKAVLKEYNTPKAKITWQEKIISPDSAPLILNSLCYTEDEAKAFAASDGPDLQFDFLLSPTRGPQRKNHIMYLTIVDDNALEIACAPGTSLEALRQHLHLTPRQYKIGIASESGLCFLAVKECTQKIASETIKALQTFSTKPETQAFGISEQTGNDALGQLLPLLPTQLGQGIGK